MKKNFSILFFLCILGFLFAQTAPLSNKLINQSFLSDYVSKNWTTEDGLPGMTITTVLQDKKGYIWIGTYDGLVRFDGIEFVTYSRSVNEKYDFASTRSLYEDDEGNLWIGHNDEGVTRLALDGSLKKYTMETGLPNNKVNSICQDHEKNMWIGTACGVCYIKPDGTIEFPNGLKELGQENLLVSKVYCDTGGRIWITTGLENDLFVYSEHKLERFTGITKFKNPAVREVIQDNTGAFWFSVDPCYAVRLNNSEENVYDVGHGEHRETAINSIIQDNSGNFWFGFDSGITVIHDGLYSYFDKNNGLADDLVCKILEDREGNIWLGLDRGGLQKMSKAKFSMVHMDSTVNAICEDKMRGLTWLGTDRGVFCYKDNQFVENEITKFCKGFRVRHVEMTKDNEILISSYSEMPQICVKPDNSIIIWTVKDGIASIKCRIATKTSSGDYYVGTTQGLNIIHKDGSIATLTRAYGFSNHYIMWLFEDKKGQVWVGTNGGGVYVLKDEKIIKHYSTDEGGLAGNVIFKILENNNSIWIGTGTGLSKYIEESDSFVNFTSRNGIGTDSVFQMICDYTQTVWMTTNKGVFSASLVEMEEVAAGVRDKISVKYYGASDGLTTSGVTSTSLSAKDSLGRIWFTLVDGFAIYDPSKSGNNTNPPQIEIQEIIEDDKTFNYDGKPIVISPATKRLSLKFTALSFISSETIQFCYKMDGFEDNYSPWSNLRLVSYTNLRPGTYQFLVMAQNSDGAVSSPTSVTIIKKSYLWQQIWFWILSAVIAICIVSVVVHITIKMRIKKADEKTEQERILNKAIIGAFANCVDGKDTYTNGHSNRVAKYTRMLAQKLGEDEQTVEKFYNIALLHDIGKIGIPDAILQKPGRLDDEEFAIMKSHAERGYMILKDVQIQEDLAAGAHHHHERFDGKGYPDGLSGENIPWVARIIAVADTFDAMSSTRPYRKKLPEDFIINEIKNCAGTQLDPKVVNKFMELYEEGAFNDVFSKI
ncbi:MAG: HD domain-containing protein [Treponema sp.]|nr:HD domain-containing protein [Treponema sp.]